MATGDVLYHSADRRPLQDVLAAIREHTTVDALGFRRERFMDRHLKSPEEMERRFATFPDAIAVSAGIAAQCRFDLDEVQYQYPYEQIVVGKTAQEVLALLTQEAIARHSPPSSPATHARRGGRGRQGTGPDQDAHGPRLGLDTGPHKCAI